ncbi:hypothetical protein ACFX2F_005784 [Malus domestica]
MTSLTETLITLSPCNHASSGLLLTLRQLPFRFELLDHGINASSASSSESPSVEEDRLWNIVRANSLDFNAWTTLIEEAETVAEDNILKIRKVCDAFLAEFPLCYGYWKKYADREARLGSIDKVVEVYE